LSDIDPNKPLKVAAVQVEARLCELSWNLQHARSLAVEAANTGARIIALPEFFTTPIVYDERLYACAQPPTGPASAMLKEIAHEHGVWIGGSYLEQRGDDVFNTYVLAEPDGTLHRHDKDIPTMVENAFYVGGSDDGLFETKLGPVGAAVCWETIRTQTVRRLRSKVGLLMTGSHWWSEPGWPGARAFWQQQHQKNAELMRVTPGTFARLVGAPLLHAAHASVLEGRFLTTPFAGTTVPTRTQLMGETQIVDPHGTILARRTYSEGAGVITAEITLGATTPADEIPTRFWIPELDPLYRAIWHHQNLCGRRAYQRAKRKGMLRPDRG